jgi:hypothetical protein
VGLYNRLRRLATPVVLLLLFLLSLERVISEEITVAAFDGAAPIVFQDESGEAAGVMPELLDQLLGDLGHEARFVTGLSFNEALWPSPLAR